jgi:hypothetical protein
MPRADPTRSSYCASRHLLRNLDDPAELRRNPMVRGCFAPPPPRSEGGESAGALDRVRRLVHASLTRCRERPPAGRFRTGVARMHAALLRCEIDKQPLSVVAAEMGLSDRQVRRERRAAHDAFGRAFRRAASAAPPEAFVDDTGALRMIEAAELHELGQSALATSACETLAETAPRAERRIEALCLAAEIELDAARYAAASLRIAEANAMAAQRGGAMRKAPRATAAQRIDLIAWSLRCATGAAGGLATPPPLAVGETRAEHEHDEERRALLVRALCAYALQRVSAGDAPRAEESVARAHELAASLDRARTKERLAVLLASASLASLRGDGAAHARFVALEEIAARRGHVRTRLLARAERIAAELAPHGGGDRALERILSPFDAGARRAMPLALAHAAWAAARAERDPREALAAADVAERLLPPRGALALLVRCERVRAEIGLRRLAEARALALSLHNAAEQTGNERVRGAAARYLAEIALAQFRRPDAERFAREALPLLERYGDAATLAEARVLAQRAGVEPALVT